MAAFDLGLIDGNDWDAAALDAVELAITTRGTDALTTAQRTALSGANRPTSRVVYDTDLLRWFYWDGAAWIPIDRTGSIVARSAITAAQSGITTVADITGLSVTWTAAANRWYTITVEMFLYSSVGGDVAQIQIATPANVFIQLGQGTVTQSPLGQRFRTEIDVNPGAGSKTYKVRVSRAAGTGSLTVDALASYPAFIRVVDAGPV